MRRIGTYYCVLAVGLGAIIAPPAAGAINFHSVEIVPAAPTISDDITLRVTANVNGALCGHALTLAWFTPDSTEIALHAVEVFTDVNCPSVEELFTFEFQLGKLAAGNHTIVELTPGIPPYLVGILGFSVSAAPPDFATIRGRFEVRVEWETDTLGVGIGRPVNETSEDSALLWFFQPDNWEVLIKVLDGCAINGHWWILGSGATNVLFTLTVHDTVTGATWEHVNPEGQPAGTFFNTDFSSCPSL